MWNEPTEEDLQRIPRLYATEIVPWADKMIYQHFFLGGCDWYVAEYAPEERIFFGYAILNDDLDNSEWGYISFDELRDVKAQGVYEVDRDLHWSPRKASEVERIVAAYGRRG